MASEATSLHREPRPAAISTPQGPAVWIIVREAISDWIEDKASVQGAALAFYSILSLAPLVVISLAIAGLFFDEKAASSQFLGQMQSMVGKEGADAISGMLEHADKPQTGTLAAVLAIVTLLFGAAGVFGQLQDTMNTIWDVKPKTSGGIWGMIRTASSPLQWCWEPDFCCWSR